MKKQLSMIIALALALVLVSCSKKGDEATPEKKGDPKAQVEKKEAPVPQQAEGAKAVEPEAEKEAAPEAQQKGEAQPEAAPVAKEEQKGESLWRRACAHMLDVTVKAGRSANGTPVPAPSLEERAGLLDACVVKFQRAPHLGKSDEVAACMLTGKTPEDVEECTGLMFKKKTVIVDSKTEPVKKTEQLKGSKVRIETSMGNFVVELTVEKTPKTVQNFLQYINDGFYEGTVFHRVIDGFVVQAGGFTADLGRKPTRMPISNEAATGLPNEEGTIAMARTRNRDSATSQFYINLRNNAMLNYRSEMQSGWGYCAFGRVVEGMDVVKLIGGVATGAKGPFPKDVPQETITIDKVVVVE